MEVPQGVQGSPQGAVPQGSPQGMQAPQGVPQGVQQEAPVNEAMSMMQGEEVSPELQQKMDAYITALMHVVHSNETNGGIVEMLKSAPPEKSVPATALQVNDMVEKAMGAKGKKVDGSVKMAGAMYLTSDLVELGNVSGSFDKELTKDDLAPILQETLSQYIHKGIKEGTIDPVELQAQTEPLMNEKQKKVGITAAAGMGLPTSPTMDMGIDALVQKNRKPLEEENKKLKGLLSQQPQQGGGPSGV